MYQIKLTNAEIETLDWAAHRGYFPRIILEKMTAIPADAEKMEEMGKEIEKDSKSGILTKLNNFEATYEIPEHAAWAISEQRLDDSDSLFACIGEPLLAKLLELELKIV